MNARRKSHQGNRDCLKIRNGKLSVGWRCLSGLKGCPSKCGDFSPVPGCGRREPSSGIPPETFTHSLGHRHLSHEYTQAVLPSLISFSPEGVIQPRTRKESTLSNAENPNSNKENIQCLSFAGPSYLS